MIQSRAAIVFMLTGLNLLNYLDRQLIAAISPNIQKDLSLSDAQVGAIGSAFQWGYLLFSPLFGRLGDVMQRKALIAFGVAAWCAATAASGLAHAFVPLFLIRVLVGIGEASYASLSPTIIDDVTPPENKGRTLAIFYSAIPIGSAFGFILGGLLDKHFGWRNAFYIAGGPGILLAFLCLAMKEPERSHKREDHGSIFASLKEIAGSRRYRLGTIGFIAQTFALGGFAFWAPQYLHRNFHMALDDANFVFGGIVVVTGFVGTFLGGAWTDRIPGADRIAPALRVSALSTLFAIPFSAACLLAPSPTFFFVAIAFAQLGIFVSMSPMNAVFLGAVPVHTRALAMALSIFLGHLLGDLISLWLVGQISDATGSLTAGMVVLPIAMVVNGIAWVIGMRAKPSNEPQPEEQPAAA